MKNVFHVTNGKFLSSNGKLVPSFSNNFTECTVHEVDQNGNIRDDLGNDGHYIDLMYQFDRELDSLFYSYQTNNGVLKNIIDFED